VARRVERAVSAACQDHAFLPNNPATVAYSGFFARGYILEEGTDAEAALVAAYRRATDGTSLGREAATAYPDGRVFVLYGDCPCLVYGPKSENIHGFYERVSLNSIRETTRTLAVFTARWCRLTSIWRGRGK